jgi:hypothetical protein
LQPLLIEVEKAATLDYLARDRIYTLGELGERDVFTSPDPLYEAEVGRCENSEVLAVLIIDAFNVLGDDESDTGNHLAKWRLLTAAPFAASLAGD